LPGRKDAHERYYKGGLRNDWFLPGFTTHREQTLEWVEQRGLDVPVLLAWGLDDPSSPFEEHGLDLLRYLAPRAAPVQMHVFNRAGHYCYREHPAEFVGVMRAFLHSCV
jgi:pimeloyl-ACP methyl ester carboxylesterase